MDSACTNLPPGFRFHPTDEELVGIFLMHKVLHNTTHRWVCKIPEVDLHTCEPWDLPGIRMKGEKDRYYFNQRDKKYASGTRSNRATGAGYWKATGNDRGVLSSRTSQRIGMKKTLVFYTGRAPRGEKTNWVMHEYRVDADSFHLATSDAEWVICRVFHKISKGKNPSSEAPIGLCKNRYPPQLPSFPRNAWSNSTLGEDEDSIGARVKMQLPCSSEVDSPNNNVNSTSDQHISHEAPNHGTCMIERSCSLAMKESCTDLFNVNMAYTSLCTGEPDIVADSLESGESIGRWIPEVAGWEPSPYDGSLLLY